jgi:squalene-hopene/tetraprenyl-beta-curcumene cyclase
VTAVTDVAPTRTATDSLDAARERLLALQTPDGWWKAELQTNVTMEAEDLMLRHFLGGLDPDLAAATARWIRQNQRPDGTWPTFFGGPPDLSTTVEAYVALRLAGHAPDAAYMEAAAGWVRAHGGIAGTRVFTRIWLAMLGQWDWESLPVLPPEIMLLGPKVPLNIYDFACWARQTIVALSVVMAFRPQHALPFGLDELRAPDPPAQRRSLRTRAGLFEGLDRLLHRYERLPAWFWPRAALRRVALGKAERWILQRQEADGLWGGIQPPVVYSIIALHLLGYPADHPVLRAAFDGLEKFSIHDDKGRRLEACQSPVWDTALSVVALADAGMPPDHPALCAARDWLVEEEIRVRGDWSVRRPDVAPSGWAFEFENDNYPDIDDTAEVVLALRRAAPSPAADDACDRAVRWTLGLQCREGGWGAFDADNDSDLVAALPFCDFGEVTDPPSADVTAHVIEMLADGSTDAAALSRAVQWLWAQQEADGSWFGRWGVNYVYGTGAAVPALMAAGASQDDQRILRAVGWLEEHQNDDGGWGEDLRSYVDPEWAGCGESTASQTAWALLALLAAGRSETDTVIRGIDWLVRNQTDDGTWDEPWFTGTGFPWDFSINYHLYRLVWPIMALGRYVAS